MKARKTIEVATILNTVNEFLLNSADSHRLARESMGMMLENVLMDTGNYKGFTYLSSVHMAESECGTTVGQNTDEELFACPTEEMVNARFANTDASRVHYYSS